MCDNICDNYYNLADIKQFTFLFAFLLLSFSTIITGIGAFRAQNTKYEIALSLETLISALAGYVYYKYLMDKDKSEEDITPYRYLDWLITTPLLLLSLMVILNDNNNFPWDIYIYVVILDIIMLLVGYLAEKNKLNKIFAWIIGTLSLIGIFILIATAFSETFNQPIFWYFVILWVLYGIVFYLPDIYKTICYNILDVLAKAIFGILTWFLSVNLLVA